MCWNVKFEHNSKKIYFFFRYKGNAYPGPSVTGCAGNEADKQIGIWERRVKGLRRMLLGWDQSRPPDPPYCTTIDVTSVNSVTIRIQESTEGAITTKFKSMYIFLLFIR